MKRDMTIAEVDENCPYSRGDVLENGSGNKLVVLERYISTDLLLMEYKVQWEHTRGKARLEEEKLDNMKKVGTREKPYYWVWQ